MAKSLIHSSGGSPSGFADFNPINLRGELPKRSREMPSQGNAPEVDLYQLWVERKGREPLRIGPKAVREFFDPLIVAINAQIALGQEKGWFNPHLLPAEPDPDAPRYAGVRA